MSATQRAILVASDATSVSVPALAAASDLARRSGSTLHIVHVWGNPYRLVPPAEENLKLEETLANAVGQSMVRAAREAGVADVHLHTPKGSPAAGILRVARRVAADLVIIGGRRPGIFAELIRARTARTLLARTSVPLLLVPESAVWPPERVVFGFDGSIESHAAAALAGWLARTIEVDVIGVWVQPLRRSDDTPVEQVAAQFVSDVENDAAATPLQASVLRGRSVRRVLLDVCRARDGAAMLAIGLEHGQRLATTTAPSDTALDVVRHARIPVLLAPAPAVRNHNHRRAARGGHALLAGAPRTQHAAV